MPCLASSHSSSKIRFSNHFLPEAFLTVHRHTWFGGIEPKASCTHAIIAPIPVHGHYLATCRRGCGLNALPRLPEHRVRDTAVTKRAKTPAQQKLPVQWTFQTM